MLSQQQIEAIILYHLYGESESAAKRFREAVTNAAKEIAAQHSVQSDKCPDCGGSGFMVKIDNRKVSCSYCNGTGICR